MLVFHAPPSATSSAYQLPLSTVPLILEPNVGGAGGPVGSGDGVRMAADIDPRLRQQLAAASANKGELSTD